MKPITEWTKDDYQLKYMMDKKLIEIPKNGVHMPEKHKAGSFKKGIFNPRRFATGPASGTQANASGLDTWFINPDKGVASKDLNMNPLHRFFAMGTNKSKAFPMANEYTPLTGDAMGEFFQ